MRKLLFAVITVLTLYSCSDSNSLEIYNDTRKPIEEWDGESQMSNHYITEYLVLDEIKVVHAYDGAIALALIGDEYATYFGKNYKHYEFVEGLSELYGDTSYIGYPAKGNNVALAYPVDKMTIFCDRDFDAEHPVGKPLDDVVTLDFCSHYNFIKSGYKKNASNKQHLQDVDCYTMHLDKINADVATLLAMQRSYMHFNFTSAPAEPGEYNFTLEVTTNGETFTTEFTHTFE